MVILKTQQEIEGMHEAGKLLAECHKQIAKIIKPGITTLQIDQFVEKFLAEHNATPEQKGYHGFPFATCASVNEVVCHGFPSDTPLKTGDIVTIDMVVKLNGYLADSAWSYAVGELSEEAQKLMDVTKKALYLGIEQAVVGNRIGDIGHAIQTYAEGEGFSVVRQFIGHGIGANMHEDPEVPHFGKPGKGLRLKEGMVITIEPMINTGTFAVRVESDGWTAKTADGGLSCQYEHTLAITKDGPLILTEQDPS
ncbi:type I methionyl aminopeptidase [Massilibacterium senegalense]|uniref:type I methionyl aminopeptidase n=1 Tax=Massilibacterium senegalense TaxID=1632858 RepID=UPI0007811CFC|nr:type I methionyl aminopeptidase [Massilibacterium senegalense]